MRTKVAKRRHKTERKQPSRKNKNKPEPVKAVVESPAKPVQKRTSTGTSPRSPTEIWGTKVALIVSDFNSEFTEKLAVAATEVFQKAGVQLERFDVPGAFEIPGVMSRLGRSRRYDGLTAIGCVIRGETSHYDLVVQQVREGVGRLSSAGDVAVTFGVLAAEDRKQAIDRSGGKFGNVGKEAAAALLKLIPLYRRTAHPGLAQNQPPAA